MASNHMDRDGSIFDYDNEPRVYYGTPILKPNTKVIEPEVIDLTLDSNPATSYVSSEPREFTTSLRKVHLKDVMVIFRDAEKEELEYLPLSRLARFKKHERDFIKLHDINYCKIMVEVSLLKDRLRLEDRVRKETEDLDIFYVKKSEDGVRYLRYVRAKWHWEAAIMDEVWRLEHEKDALEIVFYMVEGRYNPDVLREKLGADR